MTPEMIDISNGLYICQSQSRNFIERKQTIFYADLNVSNSTFSLTEKPYSWLYLKFKKIQANHVDVNVSNYIRCRLHNRSNRDSNSKIKIYYFRIAKTFPTHQVDES